jgi:hypothetical protein
MLLLLLYYYAVFVPLILCPSFTDLSGFPEVLQVLLTLHFFLYLHLNVLVYLCWLQALIFCPHFDPVYWKHFQLSFFFWLIELSIFKISIWFFSRIPYTVTELFFIFNFLIFIIILLLYLRHIVTQKFLKYIIVEFPPSIILL